MMSRTLGLLPAWTKAPAQARRKRTRNFVFINAIRISGKAGASDDEKGGEYGKLNGLTAGDDS